MRPINIYNAECAHINFKRKQWLWGNLVTPGLKQEKPFPIL